MGALEGVTGDGINAGAGGQVLCSAVCCGRPVWGSVLAGQGLGVGGREGEIEYEYDPDIVDILDVVGMLSMIPDMPSKPLYRS